mmetsp:Transcript_51430/g.124176  ORF Transcript_51430/g.124176 Transcript_51430/m.124176 type:complete len:105 (-) Transcript_51430:902-1216(-)
MLADLLNREEKASNSCGNNTVGRRFIEVSGEVIRPLSTPSTRKRDLPPEHTNETIDSQPKYSQCICVFKSISPHDPLSATIDGNDMMKVTIDSMSWVRSRSLSK